ncbi:MAG: type II toxin-antitoxin system HicB family antitoxin [Acidobacteriota bacterium]|nr:type II toxin-antitoxin system HicB family antitoxin [Blastocatellia bacterium]MDW8239745.1 type II toxin-antitoxin system HicB family antitoxin [Acidobacteriota bacterium]
MKVREIIKRLEKDGWYLVGTKVIVEKGEKSYGAYVPDLPGCVAVAETKEEVLKLIREAIELHVESMKEEGLSIPQPRTISQYVEV